MEEPTSSGAAEEGVGRDYEAAAALETSERDGIVMWVKEEGFNFPLFHALRVLNAREAWEVEGQGWLFPLQDQACEMSALSDMKVLLENR